MKKAVFLDRDGVINLDKGYVSQIEDFQLIDGVISACARLKQMGFLLIVVTNQSGIARGFYSVEDYLRLTQWMEKKFADENVYFDKVLYCPDHPDVVKKECWDRKPNPGMFLKAKDMFDIDMTHSFLVGDKLTDVQAGKNAHVGTNILVKTGQAFSKKDEEQADYVLESLVDLPALIATINSEIKEKNC